MPEVKYKEFSNERQEIATRLNQAEREHFLLKLDEVMGKTVNEKTLQARVDEITALQKELEKYPEPEQPSDPAAMAPPAGP
jgi:hypothetical protein